MSKATHDLKPFLSVNRYILLSFQSGIPDSPGMSKAMVEQKQKERKFLEQLLDGKKVEDYTIPVPIKAELRKYQQVRQANCFA